MRLVLLFFCAFLVFLILIFILTISSSIKLNVEEVYISNIGNGIKKKKLDKEFLIYLEIYLFGKIKIAKIQIDKKLMDKLKLKSKMQNVEKDIKMAEKIKSYGILKKLKIKVEEFKLNIEIGTENIGLTVLVTTLLSSIIRNSFSKCESTKIKLYCNANV